MSANPPADAGRRPTVKQIIAGLETLAREDKYRGATYEICTWAIAEMRRLAEIRSPAPGGTSPEALREALQRLVDVFDHRGTHPEVCEQCRAVVEAKAILAARAPTGSGTDADLLDAAAEYIEIMAGDLQFDVPEPAASQAAACRRAATALRATGWAGEEVWAAYEALGERVGCPACTNEYCAECDRAYQRLGAALRTTGAGGPPSRQEEG